jgi:hypothetical protein
MLYYKKKRASQCIVVVAFMNHPYSHNIFFKDPESSKYYIIRRREFTPEMQYNLSCSREP